MVDNKYYYYYCYYYHIQYHDVYVTSYFLVQHDVQNFSLLILNVLCAANNIVIGDGIFLLAVFTKAHLIRRGRGGGAL
jgi:hypothetical protein